MSCVVGDLDQDGVPEFIISTRNPDQLHWFGRTSSGAWEPHLIDDTFPSISVGGALVDLTGSRRLDLIAGTSDRGSCVYWWECPADPTQRWVRRDVFRLPANRIHDLLLADIDGDGRQELYVWNQDAETLFSVPLPDDPYVTPWPDVQLVVTGADEQRSRLPTATASWNSLPGVPGIACCRTASGNDTSTSKTMAACAWLPPISTVTGGRR